MGQRVPVVIHVISQNPYAITDAQIINAVNDLNDAFAHTGAYGSGPGANTGISFCLAQIDPLGGITNGITRTVSVLGDMDADIEDDRLKNLVDWDPKQYCNIWLVDTIREEIFPSYSCGAWTRMKEGGYATALAGNPALDGIVVTGFGQLLAHEMGHYLSLLHTFTIGNCTNNDCSVDGDGVCDTPPSSTFGSCSPQNSCSSDTLSGFGVDVPDLNQNFMCYSTCRNMFTAGQGQKMRNFLTGPRASLLLQNKCNKPCNENILAGFNRDNWFPATGSTINFTSTSTGGSVYEWSVNGVVTGGNSPTLTYTFPSNGKYRVTLKVSNGNPACFASYSDDVIVTCGVMARFYPDKRIIASKAGIMLDTILFKNRSENATSYQWLMSNDKGMAEQVVSNSFDLNYAFDSSANYSVRLIASNGPCADTTKAFTFRVEDPTVDGYLGLSAVECFQQTKITLSLSVCNAGYATIPAGTPISFYDADPGKGNANKLDTTFLMPDSVKGACCSVGYTLIIDVKRIGLNTIYAVFNDNGSSSPWKLPNTALPEKNYTNNVTSVSGFQFKVSIVPPSITLQPGDTLTLQAKNNVGSIGIYNWSTSQYLSCTSCPAPQFIAVVNGDARKRLIATSTYGCIDSAFNDIKVPPADDFTVTIDNVVCSGGDSLKATFTICNQFARGIIPKGLKVSFYNQNPTVSSAQLLSPVFALSLDQGPGCATYAHNVKGSGAMEIFAVVNDKGSFPHSLPNDTIALEKDYTNNMASYTYRPDAVNIFPADTTVFRLQNVTLNISSPIANGSVITWLPDPKYTLSCTNCLSPVVQAKDSAVVKVKEVTSLGCIFTGQARINIFPPDLTVAISETRCYSANKTLVRFRICMNNAYDSIYKGIPVSFYDADPSSGRALLLNNSFKTLNRTASCDTFSAIINSPSSGKVFAAVNDDGGTGSFPSIVYNETDFTNNLSRADAEPFIVTLVPADTTIYRLSSVQLQATISGGRQGSVTWSPANYLSCTGCLDPLARPPYSQQYILSVKNENSCIATDTAMIRTFTDGRVNIPNAFTPNGDGKNEVFYVLGSQEIEMISDFGVYDRYGQKVFGIKDAPPNNPVYGWDGKINGKTGPNGTYVYSITITFKDKSRQLFKGTITLIH